MLKIPPQKLRKAGLSGAKVLAMKDLAKKALSGIVPTHDEALKLSDEELVGRLVSVRGIGAWTVEMFLIFRLGRPDVLPIHDLGVKKGWSVAYGKKQVGGQSRKSCWKLWRSAGGPTGLSRKLVPCGVPLRTRLAATK